MPGKRQFNIIVKAVIKKIRMMSDQQPECIIRHARQCTAKETAPHRLLVVFFCCPRVIDSYQIKWAFAVKNFHVRIFQHFYRRYFPRGANQADIAEILMVAPAIINPVFHRGSKAVNPLHRRGQQIQIINHIACDNKQIRMLTGNH